MKTLVLILGLILHSMAFFAQDNIVALNFLPEKLITSTNTSNLLFLCRVNIDFAAPAESFLNSEWQDAIIIDNKGTSYSISARYFVKEDEIQILFDNKIKTIFPQKIKGIKIENQIFAAYEFDFDSVLNLGYFEVLSSNKISLLKRYYFKNGNIETDLYYKNNGENPQQLKCSKNQVLKLFKDNDLLNYCKNEKIDVKNEKDLIQLFNYYNAL